MNTPANSKDVKTERKRKTPNIREEPDGQIIVEMETETQLAELFGVSSPQMADAVLNSAFNGLGRSGARFRKLVVGLAQELEPKDAVEALLVSQMAATHAAMVTLLGNAVDTRSIQGREANERSSTRLSRTFLAQLEALQRYRGKTRHVVQVGSVSVHDGGQAIVGVAGGQ